MSTKENRETDLQAKQTEPLVDLTLNAEQAEETTGGGHTAFGNFNGGIFVASGD